MSKTLSLKLQDSVFKETEMITQKLHMPRNGYINAAVAFYNKLKKRALLQKELARESLLVRDESLATLEAFEAFEDEIKEN